MSAAAAEIVFRADASVAIGLGHVKRCLSLAHALRVRGARCTFVTRAAGVDAAALVAQEGFEVLVLPTSPAAGGPEWQEAAGTPVLAHAAWLGTTQAADAEQTLGALASRTVRCIVVDHYAIDARWHRRMREALGCTIAAIDDLADRDLVVDVLVDHNHALSHRAKYGAHVPAQAAVLGGPRHALLGPAYAGAARHVPAAHVDSIGIFLGGVDAPGLSLGALQACAEAGFTGPIEIATTTACPHLDALRAAAALRPRTTLLIDQPDLAAFFARHGLQIGAGGGATWERCCLGAPTVALVTAANQRQVLAPLAGLGVLQIADLAAGGIPGLAAHVRTLLDDAALRRGLSENARSLVDGRGAGRVADALLALPSTKSPMNIAILCTDPHHPVNSWLERWADGLPRHHTVRISRDWRDLAGGDLLFLVSCHQIVPAEARTAYRHTLVLHASALPQGRGMSPHVWQILEGADRITVTLLDAVDELDRGDIWHQVVLAFDGTELHDEIHAKLFDAEVALMSWAVDNIDGSLPRPQDSGPGTYYRKRTPDDSRIDPQRPLAEAFDLLRVADPQRYPAFFEHRGQRYRIRIDKL